MHKCITMTCAGQGFYDCEFNSRILRDEGQWPFPQRSFLCLEVQIFIFSKSKASFGREGSFFFAQLDFKWMQVSEQG